MHYYQFNIGDYVSHTRHLSLMEDLAFRRLLDFCYLHEAPLEGTAEQVARKIGMRDQAAEVESVLLEFFVLGDDQRWHNARVERELAAFGEKREAAVRAGKASAKARAGAQRKGNGRSTVVQRSLIVCSTDVQPDSTQETLDKNQEPESTPQPPKGGSTCERPDDVPADLWQEWVAFRKTKRAPVSPRVLEKTRRDATEAGMTMEEALTSWIAQGHVGFFPKPKAKTKATGNPLDGGFDQWGKWHGVGRGPKNYSTPLDEDDPEHPKAILANQNAIRATKGLPPLSGVEEQKILNPGAF